MAVTGGARRRVVAAGSVVWAAWGATIALSSLGSADRDALALVVLASVLFPLCALGGALVLRSGRDRLAGFLLLLSVATPTYFAYPLNLPALVVGLALLVAPSRTLGGRSAGDPAPRSPTRLERAPRARP
jgi:hypothetical protein